MTKQEAIIEMRKGVKITHEHFSPEGWMTMDGFYILLEDGVICSDFEFWRWRKDKSWNTGYSIWEAK